MLLSFFYNRVIVIKEIEYIKWKNIFIGRDIFLKYEYL